MTPEATTPDFRAPRGTGVSRGDRLRVATLNLFHYAEPGVGWLSEDAAHSAQSLAAKDAWLEAELASIDADVIGFQEVVAHERLQALCARAGYPHFAMAAEPIIHAPHEPGGMQVYRRAQQAVASRHPMRAERVTPREWLAKCLSLHNHWDFRRPPVRAHVETPHFGEVVVYCAHLKSPGAQPSDAPIHDPAPEPGRDPMEAQSRAIAKQAIQRVAEATGLYHDVCAMIAAAPKRPVIALGDMNDLPGSDTLAAMTPWVEAGKREADMPAAMLERFRMIDAAYLAPGPLGAARGAATHRSGAQGSELDFVLVSAALFPWRDDAVGHVLDRRVHDAHFRAGGATETSDHAAVSVDLARRDAAI